MIAIHSSAEHVRSAVFPPKATQNFGTSERTSRNAVPGSFSILVDTAGMGKGFNFCMIFLFHKVTAIKHLIDTY
jgi:hypothetical protein